MNERKSPKLRNSMMNKMIKETKLDTDAGMPAHNSALDQ